MAKGKKKGRPLQRNTAATVHPINEFIKAGPSGNVRVVSATGEQLGVFTLQEALAMAEEEKLDLVVVQRQQDPIVCKLKDYFKDKFLQRKKQKENAKLKAATKVLAVKEVKFRAVISVRLLPFAAVFQRRSVLTPLRPPPLPHRTTTSTPSCARRASF